MSGSADLRVERVLIQPVDYFGNPLGNPRFAVMANGPDFQMCSDDFSDINLLNMHIHNKKSILDAVAVDDCTFPEADHQRIGFRNFKSPDWKMNGEGNSNDPS